MKPIAKNEESITLLKLNLNRRQFSLILLFKASFTYFGDCVLYVTNGNVPYVTEKNVNKKLSLAIIVANLAS